MNYLAFLPFACFPFMICMDAANIELEQLDTHQSFTDRIPVMPFVQDAIDLCLPSDPVFELLSDENDTVARGWMGFNFEGIRLVITVLDSCHLNDKQGSQIWDGDSIQVGIDANGDGANGNDVESIHIGPNDAMYAFALSNGTSQKWAHYHGNLTRKGDGSLADVVVERNEETSLTTYKLFFPWSEFDWGYGFSDTIGLSVLVNDLDEGCPTTRIRYGDGIGAKLRPGLFESIRMQYPEYAYSDLMIRNANWWSSLSRIELLLATNVKSGGGIHLACGGLEESVSVPDGERDGFRRFKLSIDPEFGSETNKAIEIQWMRGHEMVLEKRFNLIDKSRLFGELEALFMRKLNDARRMENRKHWFSLLSFYRQEYAKASLSQGDNPNGMEFFEGYMDDFKRQLAGSNNSPISERRVGSFVASSDDSIQPYVLEFPRNFKPDKAYPLIVDLHGSGSPHLLSFLNSYQEYGVTPDERGNQIEAFVLHPWGRGNQGYLDYAGKDVLDAVRHVERNFLIEPGQRFLTGFSMGGWGTWYLGIRFAGFWRAIAPCAGSVFRDPALVDRVDVIRDTPVLIWHGRNDTSFPDATLMQTALQKAGNNPDVLFLDNRGHQFTPTDRRNVYDWLLKHSPH